MFKRRDWLDVHGADGGGSDSDESASDVGSHSEDSEGEDDAPQQGQTDNESDDDEDEASSESASSDDDQETTNVVSDDEDVPDWRDYDPAELLKHGVALKCMACDAMLLNVAAYASHSQSKKHILKCKKWATDAGPPVIPAKEAPVEEEEATETHAERLQRLRQLALGATTGGSSKDKKPGGKENKKGKPGKRQRAEIKAQKLLQQQQGGGKKQKQQSSKQSKEKDGKPGAAGQQQNDKQQGQKQGKAAAQARLHPEKGGKPVAQARLHPEKQHAKENIRETVRTPKAVRAPKTVTGSGSGAKKRQKVEAA